MTSAGRRSSASTGPVGVRRVVALAAVARIERASAPASGLLSSLYIHGEEEATVSRLLATHPPMSERIERLLHRAEATWTRIEVQ